jgi:hypothetical protein
MTLMQRLRLWWKGSQRRREDFAAKNAGWAAERGHGLQHVPPRAEARAHIDRDGVLSAYLDQSGRTLYYLDLSGEVIESTAELDLPRIPTQDDAADRQAFIQLNGLNANANFRETIARDRTLERAWYNFKTQRANDAIDAWLAKRSG